MPNWTTNVITLKNADAAKIAALIQAHDVEDKGILQHLLPCPEELNDSDLTTWSHGEEQAAREKKQAAMVEKYGYKSWYDWNIAHWGTKWDLCESSIEKVDDNTVTINCQTAWSPPVNAFETLVEQGWEVRALYLGEGCEFTGIWEPGNDEYYGNFENSKAAAKILPAELDDMFDIVETLEGYERDNEEELTLWIKDGVEERKGVKVSDPEDL